MAEKLLEMRGIFSKSLAPICPLPAGTVLGPKMIVSKKPGGGIPLETAGQIAGRRLARATPRDHGVLSQGHPWASLGNCSESVMLAIIPARAGSKGVPGKNKALIAGRPLVDYTVTALERARSMTGIILSTNDEDIRARYSDRASVVTVNRPEILAQDNFTTADVVAHALDV